MTCGRPPLPRARPFPGRHSGRGVPQRSAPARRQLSPLCCRVSQIASVAGAPCVWAWGCSPQSPKEPGSGVALAGLRLTCVTSWEGPQIASAGVCDAEEQSEAGSRFKRWFKAATESAFGPRFPLWLSFFTQGSSSVSRHRGRVFSLTKIISKT